MKGSRIVIPTNMRKLLKEIVHTSHLGYDSMMRRVRETIFWPKINDEIKQLVELCEACQQFKSANSKETLRLHEDGDRPWTKIGMDFLSLYGKHYLVTVDYYSGWIEVDLMNNSTKADIVISTIKKAMAKFGIPCQIVSDGGPPFNSDSLDNFPKSYKIKHIFSDPMHPKANGRAEAAVKTVENMMMKCLQTSGDMYLALLELRNTPRQDSGLSPASLMFGRNVRTLIPALYNCDVDVQKAMIKKDRRKVSIKKYYDKNAL